MVGGNIEVRLGKGSLTRVDYPEAVASIREAGGGVGDEWALSDVDEAGCVTVLCSVVEVDFEGG